MWSRGHSNRNASLSQPNVQKNSTALLKGREGLNLLALRLLDYMGATTEWKMGGGHTLQPHSLGTGNKCPNHPNFKGAQKCFIFHDKTTGDLKSHHLQALVTLAALSVSPRPPFLSAELWIIRFYLGNLGREQPILCVFPIMHHHTHNIMLFIQVGSPLGPALS